MIKVEILSDTYPELPGMPLRDTFCIDHVKEILKRAETRPILKMPPKMSSIYFTNKKNIWFGPLTEMAEDILHTDIKYQDFGVSPQKLFKQWTKSSYLGFIKAEDPFYKVNAKKFKQWVLRNAYNIKQNIKDIQAEYKRRADLWEEDYFNDINWEMND